jgi:ATP-dependent Clp protease ATP-binding subunit ClpC
MFERFTERARQVVVLAQEEARSLRHNYIGTEHVLLGLLREEEGLAARALAGRLDVDSVRTAISRIVGVGDQEVTTGQIPFTPRAKKVLEGALREALSLGHNYIGTEHIFLALAREQDGVAKRILLEGDIDAEDIRSDLIRMLSAPAGRNQQKAVERDSQWGQVKTEEETSKDDGQGGWEQFLIKVPVTFIYGNLTLEIEGVTSGHVNIRIQRPSESTIQIY